MTRSKPSSARGRPVQSTIIPGPNLIKRVALYLPIHWPHGVPTRPENDQETGGTKPTEFAAGEGRARAGRALVDRLTRAQKRFQQVGVIHFSVRCRIADRLRWGPCTWITCANSALSCKYVTEPESFAIKVNPIKRASRRCCTQQQAETAPATVVLLRLWQREGSRSGLAEFMLHMWSPAVWHGARGIDAR